MGMSSDIEALIGVLQGEINEKLVDTLLWEDRIAVGILIGAVIVHQTE